MDMKNKEQLLYFFLQGKVSLSQYDYKFMANLQTMIQNQNRVTSNQAALFDNLISKYKKQLNKLGMDKEELKLLPWKTMLVESTSEYTGATVTLYEDTLSIRIPFNKPFITAFRNVDHNPFEWDKETKTYKAKFSTIALKIAYSTLPAFFNTVKYDDELQSILNELKAYEGLTWNPTLTEVNGSLVVVAANDVLGDIINNTTLSLDPNTMFKMSQYGITVDPMLYKSNEKMKFAANIVYEAEITDIEQVIGWMKNIGCENVLVGRGLRNLISQDGLLTMIEKYGMKPAGPMAFGTLPEGITMVIQHTTAIEIRLDYTKGHISKTVVLKDSRPIEVK